MSISSALSASLSGLTASSRAAELVSSNVANALTPGYVRRDLGLAARELGGTGQGVWITGVSRDVDRILLSDRRISEANVGDKGARAKFFQTTETVFGTPEKAGSLGDLIARFDSSLIEAASRPESTARLSTVLGSAQAVAQKLQSSSDSLQNARQTADQSINNQVGHLNDALIKVRDLNVQITASTVAGRDSSALQDLRQQQIDSISAIVPLREMARENGAVALYSTGGLALLDGKPVAFGFAPVGLILPDMTHASGALSGLTVNGRPTDVSATGMLAGGALVAAFDVRDVLAPKAQTELDAVARNLMERFSSAGLDPTIAVGAPGLFTDQGAAFDPAEEVGLAGRIALNAAVDPAKGGEVWRLRDGLGATTPGNSGASALLSAMQAALSAQSVPASGATTGNRSFSSLSAEMVSGISTARLSSEAEVSFSTARATALQEQEMANSVDTDQEMQKLLLIEQSYAANAKVMQTVDDLLKILMGMI